MAARNREVRVATTKTRPTGEVVDAFLSGVRDPGRRADAIDLRRLMEGATGEPAMMWGASIVGCGVHRYRYASGHGGETCRVGFSPRAANLALYIDDFDGYDMLLARLGKHQRTKGCLHVKRLADVDAAVLEAVMRQAYAARAASDPDTG